MTDARYLADLDAVFQQMTTVEDDAAVAAILATADTFRTDRLLAILRSPAFDSETMDIPPHVLAAFDTATPLATPDAHPPTLDTTPPSPPTHTRGPQH